MRLSIASLALSALFWCLGPAFAVAATHVLLAGVTRYDHLPEAKHLKAPNADVMGMRDALAHWGVDPAIMRILADDLPAAHGRATRTNIVRELEALASPARVQSGDWVVIYLSGHGAIVRDATGTQRSGYNSVFLPADVRWPTADAADAKPENALVDTQIGEVLDRIRSLGAHVWFVNDSCHSGDSVRSGESDAIRDKAIAPAPKGTGGKPARPKPLAVRQPAEALPGRLVAFYAAQVTETAREFRGEDGRWTSAFTLALTHAMQRQGARDARSLIAQAVHGVRAMRPRGVFQTPYADDDLADGAHLLGGKASEVINRFEGVDGTLLAGVLDGFDTGAEIEIFASATSDTPLARASVIQGGLTRSKMQAVSGQTLPEGPWFARLVSPGREARLAVAMLPATGSEADLARQSLDALFAEKLQPLRAAASEREADVLVSATPGQVRILARRTLLGVVESIDIPVSGARDVTFAPRLAGALQRLDFLRRMERAGVLAGAAPAAERFKVQMVLRRFAAPAGKPCPAPAKETRGDIVTPALPLESCDAVEIEVRNIGDKPRYVQVLAVHSDGRVQTIAPRCTSPVALKLEAGQATAGRQTAGMKSAMPVIWFSLPRGDGSHTNRMTVQLISTPIDAGAVAPDPCQFERFNGTGRGGTRGQASLFEDDGRNAGMRPGEIALVSRVLEWTAR